MANIFQIQMKRIDNSGTIYYVYPKNRAKDVMITDPVILPTQRTTPAKNDTLYTAVCKLSKYASDLQPFAFNTLLNAITSASDQAVSGTVVSNLNDTLNNYKVANDNAMSGKVTGCVLTSKITSGTKNVVFTDSRILTTSLLNVFYSDTNVDSPTYVQAVGSLTVTLNTAVAADVAVSVLVINS